MRRLGIDPGQRRTGLSLCEEGVSVAVPLRTVSHTGFAGAVAAVCEVVEEIAPAELILGLPLRLDGSEGQAAKLSRRFADALHARTGLPVLLWDERLSSAEAERALGAQGVRGTARRRVVDQAAATIVLQSYLDAQRGPEDPWQDPMTTDPQSDPSPPADSARRRGRGRRGESGRRDRGGRRGR